MSPRASARNSIHDNAGLGIDLIDDLVKSSLDDGNDAGDADTGGTISRLPILQSVTHLAP